MSALYDDEYDENEANMERDIAVDYLMEIEGLLARGEANEARHLIARALAEIHIEPISPNRHVGELPLVP